MNPIDELAWRGLIANSTDLVALRGAFEAGPVTFYGGFDPTAASLHVGHLVLILTMRRLQLLGHRPIALVGGATGLIGDPRPTAERAMQDASVVTQWVGAIRKQIEPFLCFDDEATDRGLESASMVNNLDWTGSLSAINLLRDVGRHFRMGTMLGRDVVARRLDSADGLSFTEFSYQVLQGMDFLELFRTKGVTLQVAGNDQWGNIVGGVELIRKVTGTSVHGLTTPLITKTDGSKMGKSEGGAVWLDAELTSPYAFFQYWINTADADVGNYLKVFTFRSQEEIAELAVATAQRPFARAAQRTLARDVTSLVHGADATRAVETASQALFGRADVRALAEPILASAVAELPSARLEVGCELVDAFVRAGLESSRAAARRVIATGGAFLNNELVTEADAVLASEDFLCGRFALLRRGKKTLAVGLYGDG